MRHLCVYASLCTVLTIAMFARAGTEYQVVALKDNEKVEYKVSFGGGKQFEQFTAFDPKSKKFVYLNWNRDAEAPKPVATIWNHQNGETIALYKFPGVDQPLPVIPSLAEMKVCPVTGDKKFKSTPLTAYD